MICLNVVIAKAPSVVLRKPVNVAKKLVVVTEGEFYHVRIKKQTNPISPR